MQLDPAASRRAPETGPPLEFQWIESVAGFFRLRRDWDRWHASLGVDNVFQTYDWIRLWLRIYEPGARLLIGIARIRGEVIGIAPFFLASEKVTPIGPTLRAVRLLGDGTLCPDHIVLPVRPGLEDRFASGILARLRSIEGEWDRIELRDLRAGQPLVQALHEHAAWEGEETNLRERTHCPFLTLPATWEEYLATLGSKTRKTIRQRWNKIERELSATVVRPRQRADVDRFLASLEDLHGQVWRSRGRPGVFTSRRFRTFHRLHARRAFRSGRLWMLGLSTPDRPLIAVTLAFRDATAAHGYQMGHDPDDRSYGIGGIMIALCIRTAIEDGLSELDFLRGSGAYKYHLTDSERRGLDFVMRSGHLSDHAAGAAAHVRIRTGSLLRSTLGPERARRIKRYLRIR